jgi:hypothetical protein
MKLLMDRRPRAPAAALLQPRQESAALPARRNLGHKQICQALRAKTPLAVSIAMVLWPQIFPQTRWTRRFRLGHRPAAAIVQLPPQRRNPHSFASNHRFVQSLSRRQLEWLPAQKIHKKRGSLPPKPRIRTTGFPGALRVADRTLANISQTHYPERRLRPRARRAAITLRPPAVAILARNPCRRLRTSLLG